MTITGLYTFTRAVYLCEQHLYCFIYGKGFVWDLRYIFRPSTSSLHKYVFVPLENVISTQPKQQILSLSKIMYIKGKIKYHLKTY